MASATDMSVDVPETKQTPKDLLKEYLGDTPLVHALLLTKDHKFKWAYIDPKALSAAVHGPSSAGEAAAIKQMTAILEKLGSKDCPVEVGGFRLDMSLDEPWQYDVLSFLNENGFQFVGALGSDVSLYFDLVKSLYWKRDPVEIQLASFPHTTHSGAAVLMNSIGEFAVIEEDAYDASTSTIKYRYGLIGGRKERGQGAHFLGEPGGDIERETGIHGTVYLGTAQIKMSVCEVKPTGDAKAPMKVVASDDMYKGDTQVQIDVFRAPVASIPLVSSKARLNARPRWISAEEFFPFLVKKESQKVADAVKRICAGQGAAGFQLVSSSKGQPRWVLDL